MPPGGGGYQQAPQSQQQPHPGQNNEVDASTDEVWVETKAGDGKSYYYHAKSRETTWTKPEGPNVKVLTQQQVFQVFFIDCFIYYYLLYVCLGGSYGAISGVKTTRYG